VGSE
jgi:hypothetical protein